MIADFNQPGGPERDPRLDELEREFGLDAEDGDRSLDDDDADGLSNRLELLLGSLPNAPDTDADTIGDLQELRQRTDPTAEDTDGDGRADSGDPFAPAFSASVRSGTGIASATTSTPCFSSPFTLLRILSRHSPV